MNGAHRPAVSWLARTWCLFLLAAPAGFADGPGLIGQRLFGADLTAEHLDSRSLGNGYGGIAEVNLPVLPGLDVALAGAGARFADGSGGDRTPEMLSVTGVNYSYADYGKSYLSATLGHSWNAAGLTGADATRNDSYWELGTGIEVAYGRTTAANYGVGYGDSFDRNGRHAAWRFSASINHWIARRTAVVVSFSYDRIKHAPDSLVYTLGFRVALLKLQSRSG